jgi:hypothetical protein
MAYNVHVLSLPDVDVADLPTVEANVLGLPTVDVEVNSLPSLTISEIGAMGPLTLAGIPNSYTVAISSLPDLGLRLKEIPSIRAHVPANFRLGFSILGVELAALTLCGEAQIITEPYVANPCERCGPARLTQVPNQPGLPNQPNQPNVAGAVLRLSDNG